MRFVGHADITDDLNLVQQSLMIPNIKIINLDSDTKFENPNVIEGGYLLPPPDAMIAMVNQDEAQFDMIYSNYYSTAELQQYVTIIIAYLYKQGNILFYSPIVKDNTENIIIVKFLNMLYDRFGIGVGVVGQTPFTLNTSMEFIWNNLLYTNMIITPNEFLYNHPVGMQIEIPILEMLKVDMRNILLDMEDNEMEKHIYALVQKFKEKPNLQFPISRMV